MRIVNVKEIYNYGKKHADAKKSLDAWHNEVKHAEWKKPDDILAQFRRASIVGDNRAVFRIRGNRFRIVVVVIYTASIVQIKFVGTHAEYDKIDAKEI